MATQRGTFQQTGADDINMDQLNREYSRNEFATGVITLGAVLMMIVGGLHLISGIAALVQDDLFVISGDYAYQFDTTAWGWVHVGAGTVMVLVGISLFTGTLLARILGIVVASLSLIINFMVLPSYPFWATLVIAIDLLVIWALATRGGAMANREFER
jgi:hypothetical protein